LLPGSKKPSFHGEEIHKTNSIDDIPNVGIDDLLTKGLETDTANRLSGNFHLPSRTGTPPIDSNKLINFQVSSHHSNRLSNLSFPGNNPITSTNFSSSGYTASISRSDSDIPDLANNLDKHSSTDNGSFRIHGSEMEDQLLLEEEEEVEEDWDLEMAEIDDHRSLSHTVKEPTFWGRYQAPLKPQRSSAIQEKGSLLEYLELDLKEKFSLDNLVLKQEDDSFSDNNNTNVQEFSSEGNVFVDEEEIDSQGIFNQHLRGLTEWISSTSNLLSSSINNENSNPTSNARTLMESEVQVFQTDVYFIEQVLERCEQEPTKESCIYSMEVIVKWIRGICHQKTIHEGGDSERGLGSYGDAVKENGSNSNAPPIPKSSITWERLEQLFARCDYILNEQSKFTVAQILELISYLREELSAISIGLNDRKRGLAANRGHVVRDIIHFLCNQISLSRIHIYMLEIKAHINYFGDNIASHLESLEVLWDELEAIKSWLSTVGFFLPVAKIDLRNVSMDSQTTSLSARDPALNLQSHPKFEEAMRTAIAEEIRIALSSSHTTSIHYHRFNQSHTIMLNRMLTELQACCLCNKLLLLSEISSITMQKRDGRASNCNKDKGGGLSSSSDSNGNHSPFSSPASPFAGLKTGGTGTVKKPVMIDLHHMKYNVVYEIGIGSQFVDLMVRLESPSIVRAKLAFSACCYLQCLLRDSLPWQSKGKFHRVVLKKRNADGFSILKRGDSELGFGVDGDDIDYYIEDYSTVELERTIIGAFSSALGSIDEVKNLQSLLYEAAFDLFPHFKNSSSGNNSNSNNHSSNSPRRSDNKAGEKSASSSSPSSLSRSKGKLSSSSSNAKIRQDLLFVHVSSSLDMNLSVHDKIKERSPGSPPKSPSKKGSLTPRTKGGSLLTKSTSADYQLGGDRDRSILINKRIQDFVPSRVKNRALTHLLKYELFLFSFSLLSQFVSVLYDTTPNLALELYEICIRIAAHLDKRNEQLFLQRKTFLLAVKLGRNDIAVKHGRIIWQCYVRQITSNHLKESLGTDINELFFISKQLISQYMSSAQYPVAIKITLQTLSLMMKELTRYCVSSFLDSPGLDKKIDLEVAIDYLLLQLGKSFLSFGRPEKALDIFQRVLLRNNEREVTMKNSETKVTFLSWILNCFYEMRDYQSCDFIIQSIRTVRNDQIQQLLSKYAIDIPSCANDKESDNKRNEACSKKGATRSSRGRISSFRFSLGKSGPYHERSLEKCEDVGKNKDKKYFGQSAINASSFPSSPYLPSGSEPLPKLYSSHSTDSFEEDLLPSDSVFTSFADHSLSLRCLLNPPSSSLPLYCPTDHSFDLGLIVAQTHYKRHRYEKALQHLTPVIIGEEMIVGGKTGTVEGMIELASLYLLRGQIQYEACKNGSVEVRFPFEIASTSLFSTMQLLASSIIEFGLTGKAKQQRTVYQSSSVFSNRQTDKIEIRSTSSFPSSAANTNNLYQYHSSPLKSNVTNSVSSPPSYHPRSSIASLSTLGIGTAAATTKSRNIVYHNPADLLWDAMKWFRRAFDLFHAAGDSINAARSANFIAECNLLPTFVPHLYFNVPLNVAIDLSHYQMSDASHCYQQTTTETTTGKGKTFSVLPNSPSPSGTYNYQELVSSSQDKDNICLVPPISSSSSSSRNNNNTAAVSSSSSKPPLPNPNVTVNKSLAANGATVVKRFASLEEVEKVSLFALEKFLEAYVCPLELITSYLNLAEMMLITNNIQDSLHFWWEAKDLFLHLYVDGIFIPLLRVCSLDYCEKILNVVDRIVRFLWKWDKNIRNSHLNLLEIQNIASIEGKRRFKRHANSFKVNHQHLRDFLSTIFPSKPPMRDNVSSFRRNTSSVTYSHHHSLSSSFSYSNLSPPISSSPFDSYKINKKRKFLSKVRKGFYSLFLGTSLRRNSLSGVEQEKRNSVGSLHSMDNSTVVFGRGGGNGSGEGQERGSEKGTGKGANPTYQVSMSLADQIIDVYLKDIWSDKHNTQTDRQFCLELIDNLMMERIMDFGWSSFIEYNNGPAVSNPFNRDFSRDSMPVTASVSNDGSLPMNNYLSRTRSSDPSYSHSSPRKRGNGGEGGKSTPSAASASRHYHDKDRKDHLLDVVMNILRNNSFHCRRIPRYLKPFILSWGDILSMESTSSASEEGMQNKVNSNNSSNNGINIHSSSHPDLASASNNSTSAAFSRFIAARDNGSHHTLDFLPCGVLPPSLVPPDNNNTTGENAAPSSIIQQDPLVSMLLSEKPIDPFYDFDWMNDSYCLDYTPTLFPSASPCSSKFSRAKSPSSSSPSSPPPSLQQSLLSNFPELSEKYASCVNLSNAESFQDLEKYAEKVLVYRMWHLIMKNQNLMNEYRSHSTSFSTVGRTMRFSLSKLSHNMLRLKSLTRQLKGSFMSFDNLLQMLQRNSDFTDLPPSTFSASQPIDKTAMSTSFSDDTAKKIHRLQYRLPKMIYLLNVSCPLVRSLLVFLFFFSPFFLSPPPSFFVFASCCVSCID
jgi:tetratricopeptide (TPR) repeat protein